MLDILLSIDRACFIFINNSLSNPLFDTIMPLFDDTKYFIPIMLLPFLSAVVFDNKNRWKLALLIPLVIILVDQSGLLLKKIILRPRPWASMAPDLVNNLVAEKGENFSFPSNHAANMSGLATVFSTIYGQYKYVFWSISGIVIFSRVYIGVHYPSDVITGWIIGILYGLLLVKSWGYINFNKS